MLPQSFEDEKPQFIEDVRANFRDFLNHELIENSPLILDESTIIDGIKARSGTRCLGNRPSHSAELLYRMNRFCTLLNVDCFLSFPSEWGTEIKTGVFKYKYNFNSEIKFYYSAFRYSHCFSDYGETDKWEHEKAANVESIIEMPTCSGRRRINISPDELFSDTFSGKEIFIEYSTLGKAIYYDGRLSACRPVPKLVLINSSDSNFIEEVRTSLINTRFYLLSLVNKYPYHLKPTIGAFRCWTEAEKTLENLYKKEFDEIMRGLLASALQDMRLKGISPNVPF